MNSDNEELQKQLEEAVELHKQAVDGDRDASAAAYELLKKLTMKYPQNRLVQAYLGSITSLKGRDVLDMIERSKFAMRGVKLLNQAVLGDKDNIEIRLLRANVCLRLPEMYFHKTSVAIEDYNYIMSCYEKDKGRISQKLYLRVLFDLGCAYKNLELEKQANSTWDKLLASEGGDEYRDLVSEIRGNAGGKAPAAKAAGQDSPAVSTTPKKKVWTKL